MSVNVASLTGTINIDINPARRALNLIDADLSRLEARLNQLGRINLSLPSAGATANNLRGIGSAASATTNEVSGLSRALSNIGQGIVSNFGAMMLQRGLDAAVGGVKELIDRGLDYNDVLERSKIGFTTMMGSADKAMGHIKSLQTFAETTPFEFKGLVKNSQMLQGMGFKAEEVVPMLTAVGDALSAMGRPDALNSVLLQLGQMRAKGRVLAQEINIIAESGISAWSILSDKTGKTVKELQQLGEQGKLDATAFQKLFFEGLNERYGGAMKLASKTRTGLQSNLTDILDLRASEATSGLNEELKTSVNNAISFLKGNGGQALASTLNTASTAAAIAFNEGLSKLTGSGDFIKKATDVGGQVVNGLSDGIVQKTEQVKASATSTATTVIDTFKTIFDIQSPSRVMFVIGEQVAEGFIDGIESKQSEILAAMTKVFGERGAQSLFKKGVMFGPGFFTSGNAEWDKAIGEFSKARGLDPALMFAQLLQESRFNPNAKSPAGAEGLAQFMPGTARRFNLANPYDPIDSIRANADYMSKLTSMFSQFDNASALALAGYNAGENRPSLKSGVIPNIKETKDYVRIISSIRDVIGSAANEFGQEISAALKSATLDIREQVNFDLAEMPSRRVGFVPPAKNPFGEPDKRYNAIMDYFIPKPPQVDLGQSIPILEKSITKYQELIPLMGKAFEITTELEKAGKKAAEASKTSAEQQKLNLEALIGSGNKTNELLKGVYENFQKGFQQTFAEAFGKVVEGDFKGFADSLRSGFAQLLQQLAVQILTSQVMSLFFGKEGGGGGLFGKLFGGLFGGGGAAAGAGGGGFFSKILGGLFGGFFAEGGPVVAGKTYVVGEKGPELFRPNTGGRIIPNDEMAMAGAGGGGGYSIHQTNNYYIKTDNGVVRQESLKQIAAKQGEAISRAMERRR